MDAITIDRWIKGLGQSYNALVIDGVIPDHPLQELYPGRDWLDVEPVPGVELSFWAETKRLEKIFITCMETIPGITLYTGEMPEPYRLHMMQSDVRALFGGAIEFKGPTKMPQPMGMTGGWGSYALDSTAYPNVKVVFQYAASMEVKTLVFTLIDKGHE
ncbi:DUF6392 family protein [Pseudomonas sp. MDT1-17]